MRIGITYDLRSDYLARGYTPEETAELDSKETVDALEGAVDALGHETERIGGAEALAGQLVRGRRWDLVFNIAEGMHGLGREGLVPALLDAYRIPYTFSDPLTLSLALHKGVTKTQVRAAGIRTADFQVVEAMEDLESFSLPFPVFAKPVAEGTSKGVGAQSRAGDLPSLRIVCARLLEAFKQPVLVEGYLPGREFAVGLLGGGKSARVLGAMEILLKPGCPDGGYSYETKQDYQDRVEYSALTGPDFDACRDMALAAWRCLGGRDAGRVDIKMDENGVLNFLELNPLAGLNPHHSDLPILAGLNGMDYQALIAAILDCAVKRIFGGDGGF